MNCSESMQCMWVERGRQEGPAQVSKFHCNVQMSSNVSDCEVRAALTNGIHEGMTRMRAPRRVLQSD